MEALRRATSNVGELFLVDDHAPVSWQDESNHALEEADETWPHTTLIDWAPVAAADENLLWDGIHLTPGGRGCLCPVGQPKGEIDSRWSAVTLGRRTVEALTISKACQQQADRDCCCVPKPPRGVLETEFSLDKADRNPCRHDCQ